MNFNPSSDDLNEFTYLEFIDTMAFDRSKTISDYANFFSFVSKNELMISAFNQKLGKMAENIKYEFFHQKKLKKKENSVDEGKKMEISRKRLFSPLNIMAYIFVFDYNDPKSLEEVSRLCKTIRDNEISKTENQGSKNKKRSTEFDTVKIFIGNKYPLILEDEMEERGNTNKISYPIYDRDDRARAILLLLSQHFDGRDAEAKQNIFFVNTKHNIGVNNAFTKTFEKVLQKEILWQVLDFASDEDISDEENEEEINKGIINKIFCCGGRDKAEDPKKFRKEKDDTKKGKIEKSIRKAEENIVKDIHVAPTEEDIQVMDRFKFVDDDEDGYDGNQNVNPQTESKKEDIKKRDEEKKGKCFIY
jgi:hypothetical protein